MKLEGLHHVTMITADALATVEFYGGVLGLRLVKKTVNFDQPEAYHLYFGDERGRPRRPLGTALALPSWLEPERSKLDGFCRRSPRNGASPVQGLVMRWRGLEPPRPIGSQGPQPCASTYSATSAR